MIKICADEFYAIIGPLDVTLSIIGDHPYITIFKLRHSGKEVGRIIGKDIWKGQQDEYMIIADA